jgi:hypothetical protein
MRYYLICVLDSQLHGNSLGFRFIETCREVCVYLDTDGWRQRSSFIIFDISTLEHEDSALLHNVETQLATDASTYHTKMNARPLGSAKPKSHHSSSCKPTPDDTGICKIQFIWNKIKQICNMGCRNHAKSRAASYYKKCNAESPVPEAAFTAFQL